MPIDGAGGSRSDFLNLGLSTLSFSEVVDFLAARRDAPAVFIVTPNVDHVVRLAREGAGGTLGIAYRDAALRLCDSKILAILARFAGHRLSVVPGSDLTARLFGTVVGPQDRIAIVGGNSSTLPEMRERYPGPELIQHIPPMGLAANDAAQAAAAEFVERTQARFTFLAVGAPQSEMLATRIVRQGRATGTLLCIGASIEFLTGEKRRAPRWMQRIGLEWLHRLLSEPRRLWRRYLVEGPAILGIVRRWKASGETPWSIMLTPGPDPAGLRLSDEVEIDGDLPQDVEGQSQQRLPAKG